MLPLFRIVWHHTHIFAHFHRHFPILIDMLSSSINDDKPCRLRQQVRPSNKKKRDDRNVWFISCSPPFQFMFGERIWSSFHEWLTHAMLTFRSDMTLPIICYKHRQKESIPSVIVSCVCLSRVRIVDFIRKNKIHKKCMKSIKINTCVWSTDI